MSTVTPDADEISRNQAKTSQPVDVDDEPIPPQTWKTPTTVVSFNLPVGSHAASNSPDSVGALHNSLEEPTLQKETLEPTTSTDDAVPVRDFDETKLRVSPLPQVPMRSVAVEVVGDEDELWATANTLAKTLMDGECQVMDGSLDSSLIFVSSTNSRNGKSFI